MDRDSMIREQLEARGIHDPAVLAAMAKVPRDRFVPSYLRTRAYGDHPLPIGFEQTISQPYIVALMTQALELKPGKRVLEVGVGCGYQTAVLCELGATVFGIEILEKLRRSAQERLIELGYDNVTLQTADGHFGWPENAPFDAIVVAAAASETPRALLEQLAPGGRMIIPEGPRTGIQALNLFKKQSEDSWQKQTLLSVRFVPLIKS